MSVQRRWHVMPVISPLIALYFVAVIGLAIVYQFNPVVVLNIGDSYARPYLHHFYENERNTQFDFVYTRAQSTIVLPGVASGPYLVRLRMSGWRPEPHHAPVLTIGSGDATVTFPTYKMPANYDLLLPPTWGDLNITFTSDLYRPSDDDPRLLGVAVDVIEVQDEGRWPPLTTTVQMLMVITLVWWFWRRVGLRGEVSALLTGGILLLGLVGLFHARLFVTVALPHWLATVGLLHLILWPCERLIRTVLQRHSLTVSRVGWTWLWCMFGAALLFKVGGALYPHAIFIDEQPHTQRVHMVLDGRFIELYRPGFTSFLGDTVGLEAGYLPYSPLWYLIIALIHWLSGIAIGDVMNGLNALLDTSKGLMIFLIVLKTLQRERAALIGSGLYHLLPMPYFLMSWGNYPTQFGLWASLLVLTFLVLNYHKMPELRDRWRFGVWFVLLVLSILSYTIIGFMTFTMLFILIVFGILQCFDKNRRLITVLFIGMVLAETFVFAIYHVQFTSSFVNSTIPSIFNNIVSMAGSELRTDVEPRESPLSNFLANTIFLRNHTTDLLLILIIAGIGLLYLDRHGRRYAGLWSAWLGIFVLYTFVSAYVADMVLKHILFVMPLMCISAALALDMLWKRWRYGGSITIMVILFLCAVTVERWWFYLLIKRHDLL